MESQSSTSHWFSCWNVKLWNYELRYECHFILICKWLYQKYLVMQVWKKAKTWGSWLWWVQANTSLKPIKSVSPLRIKLFSALCNTIRSIPVILMTRDDRKSGGMTERQKRRAACVFKRQLIRGTVFVLHLPHHTSFTPCRRQLCVGRL